MRSRLLLEWGVVAALATLTVCLLAIYGLTQRPDNLAYDALMRLRPSSPSDVIIVAIDEPSLSRIGRWPWPRAVHAGLIERLAEAQPRAVGYDVLFDEPSAQDGALVTAMRHQAKVVLPLAFSVPGDNGAPFALQLPVPAIARVARAIGHADLAPDPDGIVRRASLLGGTSGSAWPSFAEQLYRVAYGQASPAFRRVASYRLPSGQFTLGRPLLIPFAGPAGTHRTISFATLLAGEMPAELLRNKIVIVGSVASGLGDQYPVPSGAMPGAEILANMVDALIEDRAIRTKSQPMATVAALLPLWMLLAALLLLPPRINIVLGLGLMGIIIVVSGSLLWWADIWLPPTAALAGLMIVYPLWAWRRLEAANAYMVAELSQLRTEPDMLPAGTSPIGTTWLNEAIARQTTLLHLAIGRVRDLRRFFADSLQALPDATLVTDADNQVLVANRAAEELFSASAGVRLADLLNRLTPDIGESDLSDGAREIVSENGTIFVLAIVPLNDALGRRAGSIARLTDITEIRTAVRQREDALQLLTHDMRSPQASILALLAQDDAHSPGLHDRIAGYARRTLKLADDFVHYARAQSTQQPHELLDFATLLIEAADDQWALAQAKQVRIETPQDDAEFLVWGDRSLLSRMLSNLLGNAVKYSAAGTVVRCLLQQDGDAVWCHIADQGQGIAPDELETIFRPFRRARGTQQSGVGLGLAFVRTVVQRHGGIITVASTPGEGTTFLLRLPIADQS